jgi:hypothetical protein
MSSAVETRRITTDIPARMDRLPWARWHWMILIGLGTVPTDRGFDSSGQRPGDGLSRRASTEPSRWSRVGQSVRPRGVVWSASASASCAVLSRSSARAYASSARERASSAVDRCLCA